MQRQAVPLLTTESSIVATGIEAAIARDSGVMVRAKEAGVATAVSSDSITVREESGFETQYPLKKFERSNQGTCLNQRPIISTGDRVEKGEVIADGPSTKNGELAPGTYRVKKTVCDFRGSGDFDRYPVSASFLLN